MLPVRPIMISPYVHHTMYWVKKEQFQYDEDTYKEWVAFAVEGGSFSYDINDVQGTAAFGDIVICPPQTAFRRVVITPLTFYVWRFDWTAADQNGYHSTPSQLPEILTRAKISIADSERLQQHYSAMHRAESLPEPERMIRIRHTCRGIWLLYCDETDIPDMLPIAHDAHAAASTMQDPLMHRAKSLIHQWAYEPMNLKDIAALLGISAVQLTKKFKASYGMTPIQYLTMLRLAKVKKLLLETTLTIDQISEYCGYQNGFYLSRIFAMHEQVTPSHYRKLHQV